VRIANHSPVAPSALDDQDAILLRTFASTHTILRVGGGGFLSLTDPPPAYAEAAGRCKNIGTWPVLVGQKGETGTMLSSPIILYDYPEIAPESPGDLCDGTEIDEILSLRIMTLTDAEKNQMRHVDEYARRILERTEGLSRDEFLRMHGVMRNPGVCGEDFFNPATRLESISAGGTRLRTGDRVRIRPKGRADVMDLALAGKVALIEAIEQDAENRVYLALVLDDDPGKDFGMMRQPGHRFFYAPDEVEPVPEGD
jgi:hydrogenase maturation protease